MLAILILVILIMACVNDAVEKKKQDDFEYKSEDYPAFYDYPFGSKACAVEGDSVSLGRNFSEIFTLRVAYLWHFSLNRLS